MRSDAQAKHRALHSPRQQHGWHAPTPQEEQQRLAFWATLHCLAGCTFDEVLGPVIGTVLGWGNLETIALALGNAFVFGYAFTMVLCSAAAWRGARRPRSSWRPAPLRSQS